MKNVLENQNNETLRHVQENMGFNLNNENTEGPVLLKNDGVLKWKLHQVGLFVDDQNKSYIADSFLYKSYNMPYDKCPGSLPENVLMVLLEIIKVIVLLGSVWLTMQAFDINLDLFAESKAMTILIGSCMPLILKLFLYKDDTDEQAIDDFSIKLSLNSVIKHFSHDWSVADIIKCDTNEGAKNIATLYIDVDEDLKNHAAVNIP